MQMLFQGDLGKQTADEVRTLFWRSRDDVDAETRGFAEDLYVSALATNGWSRLSEYDSSPPPVAFVLAPVPSHP